MEKKNKEKKNKKKKAEGEREKGDRARERELPELQRRSLSGVGWGREGDHEREEGPRFFSCRTGGRLSRIFR